MELEKLFILGIMSAALGLALSAPPVEIRHRKDGGDDDDGALGRLKTQCESVCAEAKGEAKYDEVSLTCFCGIAKTASDVVANMLLKKAQEIGVDVEIIRGSRRAKRLADIKESSNALDDEINHPPEPNSESDAETPLKSEFSGRQASPNTAPMRQKLASEAKSAKPAAQPTATSGLKPPNLINKKTSPTEPQPPQPVATGKPKAPNVTNKKIASTTENFGRASMDLMDDVAGEGEPTRRTIRRSTPSPRKSPMRRRIYSAESARRTLESARAHIDSLIQRTRQPTFNPALIGPEVDAICASLKSLSSRAGDASRSLERSALVEQIKERQQARLASRFGGGHEDRPRKLKPLLVGSANPASGKANKVDEPQEKKSEQKEVQTIITQPPQLVDN